MERELVLAFETASSEKNEESYRNIELHIGKAVDEES